MSIYFFSQLVGVRAKIVCVVVKSSSSSLAPRRHGFAIRMAHVLESSLSTDERRGLGKGGREAVFKSPTKIHQDWSRSGK